MEDKIQTTYTSWSALLYIRAFWNINIMSLWNSLVVRIVWNNRINAIIISEKKKTCSKWKFTRRSLPHFQCSFLLSIDPWACRTRKQSQYFSDGSYNYRVFLISNEIDSNAKQVVHLLNPPITSTLDIPILTVQSATLGQRDYWENC